MAQFISEFLDVLAKGDDLPTLPIAVLELHAALDDDLASDSKVAEIINRDPPLATRLLRLANSAAFNRGTPVGEVRGALQLLGLRQVRALSVALAVVSAFSTRKGRLDHESFWQHSAGVAFAARELARCVGYSESSPEQLYVGGLLHDVGLLLLDQYFPDRLWLLVETAEADDEALWRVEQEFLGTDHGEIAGLLLGRWSLPAPIVSMVAAHHHPRTAPVELRDASWFIYAAEILCSGLATPLRIEQLSHARASTVLDAVRSANYDVEPLLAEIALVADETAAMIG